MIIVPCSVLRCLTPLFSHPVAVTVGLLCGLVLMIGAIQNGHWVWGPGDSFIPAAVMAALHVFVACLCLWSGLRQRRPVDESSLRFFPMYSSRFWIVLGTVLLILGINQFGDLHTAVSLSGKQLVTNLGLKDQQWFLQVSFITIVALMGITGVAVFYWRIKRKSRWCYVAVAGLGLQLVFVLIRTASLNYIDELLGIRLDDYSGVTSNLALESLGLLLILAATAGELYRIREIPEIDWEIDELEECV